jgi:hypothetical protein
MTRTIGLLLLVGFGATTVLAQAPPDAMEACSQVSDAGARLACFDREIQRRHGTSAGTGNPADAAPAHPTPGAPAASVAPARASAPAAASAGNAPAPVASRQPVDDTVGLDGKQLSIRRKEEGIAPAAPTLIVAGLTQLQSRPGHQYYFELDNGQVWESVDNQGQLLLGAHDTVAIRPGMLGAFFLKTPDGISIRVHRLR